MKILEGKLSLSNFNPSYVKDSEGRVVSISFLKEDFDNLVNSIEYDVITDISKHHETISQEAVDEMISLKPEELRKIRKSLNLTQKQLGEKIGYSEGTVRHAEKGRKPIQMKMVFNVLKLVKFSKISKL